jgi:inner membrane protein
VANITDSWGGAQRFAGPMIVVPYTRASNPNVTRHLTLLPETLKVDGKLHPEQRRRGLFAVNVYTASLDVAAEFQVKTLREWATDTTIDWSSARLDIALSDPKSIVADAVEFDGQPIEWAPGMGGPMSSLKASLGATGVATKEVVTVRFRIAFGGSGSFSIVPLGRRTDATLASSWISPSYGGRFLPASQAVDKDGFRARWSTPHLGRGYAQLWDVSSEPTPDAVIRSAFSVSLFTPVDAYRQTDRAIKYGIMFIGLTFAASLLFELSTGTKPHVLQYGLIGLSLCVFYLLLLSFSEQIGFGAAYLASAAAVVAQAAIYNWSLQRRTTPAVAFGVLLTALYACLYALLQLEDVALLSGSLLLFVVLSVAMWLTRNLHRPQPA